MYRNEDNAYFALESEDNAYFHRAGTKSGRRKRKSRVIFVAIGSAREDPSGQGTPWKYCTILNCLSFIVYRFLHIGH